MNYRLVVAALAGGALVHLALLACSSSSSSSPPTASADGPPTPDFEVSAEPCDKTYTIPVPPPPPGVDAGTTTTVPYAEHAYPGKSKEEIAAHVRHWTPIDPSFPRPSGYTIEQQGAIFTKDGFAGGAACRPGTTTYFIYH
jgi:hypothetical protein